MKMAFTDELFLAYSHTENKKIQKKQKEVSKLVRRYEKKTLEELKEETNKLKKRLSHGETLEDIQLDAYALLCAAFKKVKGFSYYDEQIQTSLALDDGNLVEMLTGEGKTYALTLSAFLHALEGKGVHVITANSYLAQRDAKDNEPLFQALGLSVSYVDQNYETLASDMIQEIKNACTKQSSSLSLKIRLSNYQKKQQGANEQQYKNLEAIFFKTISEQMDIKEFFQIIENLYPYEKIKEFLSSYESQSFSTFYPKLNSFFTKLKNILMKEKKKEGYHSDITYCTCQTVAFDYLNDTLALTKEDQVLRGLHYAIIDEVDSILIDDANTPLIISKMQDYDKEDYKEAKRITDSLHGICFDSMAKISEDQLRKAEALYDYIAFRKEKNAYLTELGYYKVWDDEKEYQHHYIQNALIAQTFEKDKDYIIEDGKLVLIDQNTGRKLPDNQYSFGINQAIEAKENIEITNESIEKARITHPTFFHLYQNFSGLSGTLFSAKEEFSDLYGKGVVCIAPRKKIQRKDLEDEIFDNKEDKLEALLQIVEDCQKTGRPLLIGTSSIKESFEVHEFLENHGISHQLINAKTGSKEENEQIMHAGEMGKITVGTNMVGRGTDIKLSKESLKAGGLYVVGFSKDLSRIEKQLRGRAGRQGEVGTSKFLVSLEDPFLKEHGKEKILAILKNLYRNHKIKKMQTIFSKLQKNTEEDSFALRKYMNDYDILFDQLREKFFKEKQKLLEQENITKEIQKIFNQEWNIMVKQIKNQKKYSGLFFDDQQIEYFKRCPNLEKEKFLFEKEFMEQINQIDPKKVKEITMKAYNDLWSSFLEEEASIRYHSSLYAYAQRDISIEYNYLLHEKFEEKKQTFRSELLYHLNQSQKKENQNKETQDKEVDVFKQYLLKIMYTTQEEVSLIKNEISQLNLSNTMKEYLYSLLENIEKNKKSSSHKK